MGRKGRDNAKTPRRDAGSERPSILASVREARRKREEPLEVRLSVRYRFGEAPEDQVTMVNDRPIPMVGSVFRHRDAIVRNFAFMTLRAGVHSPSALAELLPPLRWLGSIAPRGKKSTQGD